MISIQEAFYEYVKGVISEEKLTEKEQEKQIDKIRSARDMTEIFLNGQKESA